MPSLSATELVLVAGARNGDVMALGAHQTEEDWSVPSSTPARRKTDMQPTTSVHAMASTAHPFGPLFVSVATGTSPSGLSERTITASVDPSNFGNALRPQGPLWRADDSDGEPQEMANPSEQK